ncbi:MAG: hypothetical protein SGJ19_09055 [Planctomycetia bacterium]|nr:hypothetical protein [Planctomycetia bacterium]
MEKIPVWQYSIRTLLIGVAGVALVLAIGNWIGALWMSLTVWTLLMIAAHVAGMLINRRRVSQAVLDEPHPHHLARGAPLPPAGIKDASQLAHSRPLAGWVRRSAIGGAVLGALGGLGGMWILRATNIYGLVLGTLSAAVLGCFFAFLTASFLAIAANAFGEARQEDRPEAGQPRV